MLGLFCFDLVGSRKREKGLIEFLVLGILKVWNSSIIKLNIKQINFICGAFSELYEGGILFKDEGFRAVGFENFKNSLLGNVRREASDSDDVLLFH